MPRHVQLRADALLLRRNTAEVADILVQLRHHVLEGVGQVLQLVAGIDLHPEVGQSLHFALHQSHGRVVQHAQRAYQYPPHIVVVRKNGRQQHRKGDAQGQHQELAYLLVDHVHGDVDAGQRHRRTSAVQDSYIGRCQIAVLLIFGDQYVLLRVHGKGLMHQFIAAAVIGVGIPQVADAVLTGHARVPDIVHHLSLGHHHIEILQPHLLLGVQQIAVYLVVVFVLFAGPIVLLHLVAVDEVRRHGRLSEGQLGVALLHSRPVQLRDGRRQYAHEHGGHDHQSQQQLGLQPYPSRLFHFRTSMG